MEVILPSGELMRTGMGALPQNPKKGSKHDHDDEGNKCWQLFPYGFGPYNDGIFSQGNVGICTKMGLWVRRLWKIADNANYIPVDAKPRRIPGIHDLST